jgi:hypothetical protein
MSLRILRVLGLAPTATAPTNYQAVNEGRKEFTVDGQAIQVPMAHLVDSNGNTVDLLGLPTGAAKESQQIITNAGIDALYDGLGTRADDAATTDAAEASLIGLVKRLLGKFSRNAEGNLSTAIAEALPAGTNNIGHVTSIQKTNEAVTYFGSWISGTAVAGSANFFVIRNPHATRKVRIQAVDVSLMFSGTAAAGRSPFQLVKFSGGTFASTGTPVAPVAAVSGGQAAVAVVSAATAGISVTNPGDQSPVAAFALPTQLAATAVYSRRFDGAPLVLGQNEALVLQGFGAVTGTTVAIAVEWTEE